jgi:Domain of unknown function (DUF1957)
MIVVCPVSFDRCSAVSSLLAERQSLDGLDVAIEVMVSAGTAREQKLLLYVIAMIEPEDEDFKRTLALRQIGRELLLAQSSDWAFFDEDRNGSCREEDKGSCPAFHSPL